MDAVGFAPGWSRICTLLLPEYIWLATGGKSQFNDRLMVLKGRKVTAWNAMPHQSNESAKWT